MKVCRLCGSEKLPPSCYRRRRYYCSKCTNARPASKRARIKWMQTHGTKRMIRINNVYLGYARTEDEAERIKQNARRRLACHLAETAAPNEN